MSDNLGDFIKEMSVRLLRVTEMFPSVARGEPAGNAEMELLREHRVQREGEWLQTECWSVFKRELFALGVVRRCH